MAAAASLWVFAVFRLTGIDTFTPVAQLVSFTPYAVPAGLVVALAGAMARRWQVVTAALIGAVMLAGLVAPRAIGGDAAAGKDSMPLQLMTANLWQGNAVAELMTLVRRERPDLLSVQEITPEAAARLRRAGLRDLLPHDASRLGPGVSGTALYGRARFTKARSADPRSRFDMARASYVHSVRGPGR